MKRHSLEFPVPQNTRAWVATALVIGSNLLLIGGAWAVGGWLAWAGALAGIVLIEVGFRWWRARRTQKG